VLTQQEERSALASSEALAAAATRSACAEFVR
jgi:hypothetical protein